MGMGGNGSLKGIPAHLYSRPLVLYYDSFETVKINRTLMILLGEVILQVGLTVKILFVA